MQTERQRQSLGCVVRWYRHVGQTALPLRPCQGESETLGVLVWMLLTGTVFLSFFLSFCCRRFVHWECTGVLSFVFPFSIFHFSFFIFSLFSPSAGLRKPLTWALLSSPRLFLPSPCLSSPALGRPPHWTCRTANLTPRQSAASFRSTPPRVRAVTQHSSQCLCCCAGEYTLLHTYVACSAATGMHQG